MECFKPKLFSPEKSRPGGNSHIEGMMSADFDRCTRKTLVLLIARATVWRTRLAFCLPVSFTVLPRLAHRSEIGHALQLGMGMQTVAPNSIIAWLKSPGRAGAKSCCALFQYALPVSARP